MKLIYIKNELKKCAWLLRPFLILKKELGVLVAVDIWKRQSNADAVGNNTNGKQALTFDQEAADRYIELLPHD